jgi:hypothetical protein
MARHSFDRRQLSRSKLDLFLECPRCFYEDIARRNGRPSGPSFTLNLAVDELFKREFDAYRARQAPHPLFATAGLDAVPFSDPRMDAWRSNFTGVRWVDETSGWTLCGAVDDLWRAADGQIMVADYKATSKMQDPTTETLYPGYRRQMDIYQFLLSKQELEVSDRAWFVVANGLKSAEAFNDTLHFRTTLVPYDGDRSWVLEAFRRAVSIATGSRVPEPSPECGICRYVNRRSESAATTPSPKAEPALEST